MILFAVFISFAAMAQETDTAPTGNPVIPVITLTDSELEGDNQSQDISGLLQSNEDIYVNTAGYTFGQARFKIRGYDNQNSTVLMNGIYVNDAETGGAYYSNWGGLNDATRNKVNTSGLEFSDYTFGGIGGVTNIITRASEFRTGSSVSYALANKNYRNRIMVTHSTGMMDNGWAFTFSASTRWAKEGYVKGTFYEAYAYFLAAEKKINDKQSLNLTIYGSPTRSGRAGVATLETYELSGDHYYNPNWGYQNGVVRNARVGNYHQPRIILSHYWEINKSMKLTTSGSYMFGRGGTTALNWYDSPDPRPDYYRNFPSYYDAFDDEVDVYEFNSRTELWTTDEAYRQLDWDAFYDANRKNLYPVLNESGIIGNNIEGNRAAYIIEERRNDLSRIDFSSVLTKDLNESSKIVAGVSYLSSKTHNFKVVDDLLGADWWLDIDQFAERDFDDDTIIQNNLAEPNKVIYEGEIFGYDYVSNVNKTNVFGQVEYKLPKLDFFGGINLSYTEFWRTGNMKNGKFPLNSYGDSEKNQFYNYAVKAGLNYKITGRNFLLLNATYLTRAPYSRDAYISPRTRDHVVSNLESEIIMSGDISYHFRAPKFQAKITGFYTEFQNGIENNNFYHDELRTFVNYIMTNVDKLHYGGELGIEAKVSSTVTLTAATGYGKYLYNSRPSVTIAQDNSSEIKAENRTVYLQNYHLGGMPEFAASVGGKYNAPKYWFVGVNAN